MKKAKLFEIRIANRDRTHIKIVANCKLDAVMAYKEWIKYTNDPEYVSEDMGFDVEEIGKVYISDGIILK